MLTEALENLVGGIVEHDEEVRVDLMAVQRPPRGAAVLDHWRGLV